MRGHNTGGYYQCLMYDVLRTSNTLHKKPCRIALVLCGTSENTPYRKFVHKGRREENAEMRNSSASPTSVQLVTFASHVSASSFSSSISLPATCSVASCLPRSRRSTIVPSTTPTNPSDPLMSCSGSCDCP